MDAKISICAPLPTIRYIFYQKHINFLNRAVDTPSNGKDVVDVINSVQKQYLATCLKMLSTTKVDKIDSKRMRVDAMTTNVKVGFAGEFNPSLDIRDEIGTKIDEKHMKREAKSHLNHKYHWVHKEEDILFNGMKAVYNIRNNQDEVTMKQFYHIR